MATSMHKMSSNLRLFGRFFGVVKPISLFLGLIIFFFQIMLVFLENYLSLLEDRYFIKINHLALINNVFYEKVL